MCPCACVGCPPNAESLDDPRNGGPTGRRRGRPGASPAVIPREAPALSAPARQLTPQADERGSRLRARALTTTILAVLGVTAVTAPAGAQAPASPEPTPASPEDAPSVPAAPAVVATGGAAYAVAAPQPVVAGGQATIVDGLAQAPADAPPAVQQAIWAANEIVGKPYRYGGGHRPGFKDRGYDCSGTVSYALHGAMLLKRPLDSRRFMRWGAPGPGSW